MAIGKLLVWLRPNADAEDVFIPAQIATEIREKLIKADRLSMLTAVAIAHLPNDPYSLRMRADLINAQEAFETKADYSLALVQTKTERERNANAEKGFKTFLSECGQKIRLFCKGFSFENPDLS